VLPVSNAEGKAPPVAGIPASTLTIGSDLNLERMERAMIEAALRRTGDNRTEAAELLGLSRRTMQRKLQEMGRVKRVRRNPGAGRGASPFGKSSPHH
jgi:DNA-binding NtrC family response regulator